MQHSCNMLQLIGLLVCFYVAMRGFDWLIVSKEARHTSTFYGRATVGIITVLGALGFAVLLIAQGAEMPAPPR